MASVTLSLSSRTNRDTGKAEVLLRYRNTREVALRVHTHIFILPKFFADGAIVIKQRIITEEVRKAHEAKAQLDRIVGHITSEGDKKAIKDFTQDWAQDTIYRLLYPENYCSKDSGEVCFFDNFDRFLKLKKLSDQRRKSYRCIFNTIRRYELYNGGPISLDRATPDTLASIEDFFRNEYKFFAPVKGKYATTYKPVKKYEYVWANSDHERAPQRRSDNAIVTYMSAVRAYWLWCIDIGYTQNNPFRKYSIRSQSFGTPYYLTTAERDQLYKADMGDDAFLAMARDILVFQCHIGCRIGDLFAMTRNNVVKSDKGTAIQYIPNKTKEERPRTVKVYLSPTAVEVLDRYSTGDSAALFPTITTGKLNEYIRIALKKAGIERVVTIVNPKTGRSEQRPICEVGSSHMARRTFVGNL